MAPVASAQQPPQPVLRLVHQQLTQPTQALSSWVGRQPKVDLHLASRTYTVERRTLPFTRFGRPETTPWFTNTTEQPEATLLLARVTRQILREPELFCLFQPELHTPSPVGAQILLYRPRLS